MTALALTLGIIAALAVICVFCMILVGVADDPMANDSQLPHSEK